MRQAGEGHEAQAGSPALRLLLTLEHEGVVGSSVLGHGHLYDELFAVEGSFEAAGRDAGRRVEVARRFEDDAIAADLTFRNRRIAGPRSDVNEASQGIAVDLEFENDRGDGFQTGTIGISRAQVPRSGQALGS